MLLETVISCKILHELCQVVTRGTRAQIPHNLHAYYLNGSQETNTCLKSAKETMKNGVGNVQS